MEKYTISMSIVFFLYLIYLNQNTICQTCISTRSIVDTNCFTNIIYDELENRQYRAIAGIDRTLREEPCGENPPAHR